MGFGNVENAVPLGEELSLEVFDANIPEVLENLRAAQQPGTSQEVRRRQWHILTMAWLSVTILDRAMFGRGILDGGILYFYRGIFDGGIFGGGIFEGAPTSARLRRRQHYRVVTNPLF